jgi:mono/diheme cytochrome c family protein
MRMTSGWIGGAAIAGMLTACAPQQELAGVGRNRAVSPPSTILPAGGTVLSGATIASTASQYARPVLGPTPAAGASAWVRPAPPPAFAISTPLPPGEPPAPPPAAVVNRQPPAAPSEAVRPEAAGPGDLGAAPAAPAAQVDLAAGRRLFADYACGACHILADAGGAGGVGPSLDRNSRLTRELAIDVIARGSGAMPAFAGQMSDAEISTLADYVVRASRQ